MTYDVFLSFTWSDITDVLKLERALKSAGLSVFRDSQEIQPFEGITEGLEEALASSKVLVAYYSRRFPLRYACQWELTSAFVAAQVRSDPRHRVLVVNPERDGNHIAPVELEDAVYAPRPGDDQGWARIAELVAARVHAARTALGEERSTAPLLPRLLRPRRFVGRYRELWKIHSALHARDLPPATPRTSTALAVVRGFAGLGKTSLAEQYAFLFRDAFPGGVRWLDLYGQDDPIGAPGRFHECLRGIAGELGIDFAGLPPGEVRARVARRIETERRPQLWIIDDVPSELPADALDELVMPTSFVRTVITTRTGNWPAPAVDLNGLSEDEGSVLYDEIVGSAEPAGLAAVRRLIERCGGHPLVLTSALTALREGRGAVDESDVLDGVKGSVVEVLRQAIGDCEPAARRILQVAAAISRAPVPPELVLRVLPGERVADAVVELTRRGLLTHLEAGWDVHALVRDAAGLDDDLTRRTAVAVLELAAGTGHVHRHAAALAEHECVPADQRVRLLRTGLDWFRRQGDVVAARAAADRILAAPGVGVADQVAAAAALVEAGEFAKAADVCGHLAPVGPEDAFRAGLTRARALDQLGRYAEADEHWPEQALESLPAPEKTEARVFIAVARRMRGQFREALELLGADEPDPRARLELARLRIITGDIKQARLIAEAVIREHDTPDHERHPLRLEAIGVHAEAEMTLDLTERKVRDEGWDALEAHLRSARDSLAGLLGEESPLTLAAGVRCARTSVTRGRPKRALREFAKLEPAVREVFQENHPLYHWLRYSTAQAHAQLKQYEDVVGILRALLERQQESIGPRHPDTMMTQLDLGIALALTGHKPEASELVTEAEQRIGESLGWRSDLRMRAGVTRVLMNLPVFVWQLFPHLDDLFGKKKPEEG